MGIFSKIIEGLKKTKNAFVNKLNALFGLGEINSDFYEELEYILVSSDIGVETSQKIITDLKQQIKKDKIYKSADAKDALKTVLINILMAAPKLEFNFPTIITIVGVNGVGKTTTIGKLANYFKKKGKQVALVAGDTFRAAASDQLSEWANRNKVKIIKHTEGADAAAVVYDGIMSAKAKNTDVLIVDTAGRLHTKANLMEELKKIDRVIKRETNAKVHNLIVLDSTIGQNSIVQVNAFKDAIGIDGIVLTKLDGTSKGGAVFSIVSELNVPICFVGLGEGIDDLEEFDVKTFVDGII